MEEEYESVLLIIRECFGKKRKHQEMKTMLNTLYFFSLQDSS